MTAVSPHLPPHSCSSLSPTGMWSFSVSELAVAGAEIGRISATDADLGENARMEFTILDGESGDTFNITGINHEAVIVLNKVRLQSPTSGSGACAGTDRIG